MAADNKVQIPIETPEKQVENTKINLFEGMDEPENVGEGMSFLSGTHN